MFYKKLPSLNLLVISISFAFIHNSAVANNVIVDAGKSANTTVSKNGDGSETISINKANDMNLSVNYFEQFNVGKEGVNIDNSEAKAKVILNEVTSKKTSSLEGKISVLGQDAELIIANPNGIDCYGCQFSGSDKVMLISGKLDSITGKKIYLSDGYVNLKNVNNFNEKQTINVFSNRINILGKNKIPSFNVINGYETVSFVDYVWKGKQEKRLSKNNKKEGMSILENSSLKTDLFSLQGGILNLDGKLVTKKINIIQNKEINANEGSVFKIAGEENEFREYNEVELLYELATMKLGFLEKDAIKSTEIALASALELEVLEEKIMELDPDNIHKNKLKKIRELATEARRVADQQQAEYNKIQSAVSKIDEGKQAEKRKLDAKGKKIGSALQYIESDDINFKGKLAIINSEILFNARNINVDIDKTKTVSYFRNSDVAFNAHQDNKYSGKFGLINSSIRFLGYRNIPMVDGNDDNSLDKNKLNDINLNKLSMFGFGHIVAHGENINITDVKFKENVYDNKLRKTYIDLIANNELNIKGQFEPSLINMDSLYIYEKDAIRNSKVINAIKKDKIKSF